MNKIVYLIVVLSFSKELIAQNAFNLSNHSLNYKSFSLLNLTQTNIRLESQYGKTPQIFTASESSFARFSLESGIIGLGFIPLKIQGFYSTEKQNLFQENYLRFSFDLNLLYEYQKSKSLEAIENENRKLISLKRDYGRQKSTFRSKVKFNDSLVLELQTKLKLALSDTISALEKDLIDMLEDSLNRVQKNLENSDSNTNINNKTDSMSRPGDTIMQKADSIRQKADSIYKAQKLETNKNKSKGDEYKTAKHTYQNNYRDSLEKALKRTKLQKADSTLRQIEKLKGERKGYENQLNQTQDSIKKIENTINSLIKIVNNPKEKVQEMVDKRVTLPRTLQIGRINPYLTEAVFNGTPAQGILVEFGNDTNNTTISIGRLASLKEGTLNDLKFKSEYLAIKTGSKYKKLNYEFGLFSCLKDMPQGNQFFAIPFGTFSITNTKGITIAGEFANSIDYRLTQIETTPEGLINSGYAANFSFSMPISHKASFKLLLTKSSEDYRSPGNPYFISGPLKLLLEYSQSLFKEKLKVDLGIRENHIKKSSGRFWSQTFSLRAKSNFTKRPNFTVSYLPIQSRSEFNNNENSDYLMQTNILNIMTVYRKKFNGYLMLQNLGFWTKSQDGLKPDFESKNYFYTLTIFNSMNNKVSLNYNFGKGHTRNDSLNQTSLMLSFEYKIFKKKTALTGNFGYIKPNYYTSQQTILLGIKQNVGKGVVWIESGGQKLMHGRFTYLGRLRLDFNF